MTYAIIETLHRAKYLQPFAMNILLFILHSSSFCFISLIMMLNLIFNEHLFKKERKKKKRNKITKDICHGSFYLIKL